MPDAPYQGVYAIDDQNVWITATDTDSNGAIVCYSQDGGDTWQRQGTLETEPDTNFLDISMLPDGTGWAVGRGPNFINTKDYGQNWTHQYGSLDPNQWFFDANAVWATSDQVFWVALDMGTIMRTGDGGLTWVSGSEQTHCYMMGVVALDPNIAWSVGVGSPIPGTIPGSIARTLDAGATWVNQELPVPTGLWNGDFVH